MSQRGAARSDLWIGAQLALRTSRVRTVLTAIGLGAAVVVLLVAAAVPHASEERSARGQQLYVEQGARLDRDRAIMMSTVSSNWRGQALTGNLLWAEGTRPAVPPGVEQFPRAGELVVSPALRRALAQPDAQLLRDRIPGRIVGEISPAGLTGPRDLVWYRGDRARPAADTARGYLTVRGDRFGPRVIERGFNPYIVLLIVVGSIALLVPVGVLVATAARLGGEGRERRYAALRLMGASTARTARVAAGESLVAAVLALLLGGAVFLVLRANAAHISILGVAFFPGDLTPSRGLLGATILGVPLITVSAALFGMRRAGIDPLGTSKRQTSTARRRLAWRLLLPTLGVALLAASVSPVGNFPLVRIGIGVAALLIGSVFLLPWLLERVAFRLPSWSVPSQLALRSLQQDSAGPVRVVSGVIVTVAGAIGVFTLIAGSADRASAELLRIAGEHPAAVVRLKATDTGRRGLAEEIAATQGISHAAVLSSFDMTATRGRTTGQPVHYSVGGCRTLSVLGVRCKGGHATALVTTTANGGMYAPLPEAGSVARLIDPMRGTTLARVRLPRQTPTVPSLVPLDVSWAPGVLSTELPSGVAEATTNVSGLVWLKKGDDDAIERLRNAVLRVDPFAEVLTPDSIQTQLLISKVRRALLAGTLVVLVLLTFSLLVTTGEQLMERRRVLATLSATGLPRKVLRRSLWWRAALPIGLSLLVAVPTGLGVGWLLLAIVHRPPHVDLEGTALIVAMALGLIVLAAGVFMPFLGRIARPEAMRTE